MVCVDRKINYYKGGSAAAISKIWKSFQSWYAAEGEERSLYDFTSLDADDYLSWLRARKGRSRNPDRELGVCDATCKEYLSKLGSLWEAAFRTMRVIRDNPWSATAKNIRAGNSNRMPTEELEGIKIKDFIEGPSRNEKIGLRDRALFALMYGAGLRCAEARDLKIGDIIDRTDCIQLNLYQTKNGQDASPLIDKSFAPYILDYLQHRLEIRISSTEPFLIPYLGKHEIPQPKKLCHSTVRKIFNRNCKKLGVKNISSHSLRKTAITDMLRKDVPHRIVRNFSRHSSVAMVERYDADRLKKENNPFRLIAID